MIRITNNEKILGAEVCELPRDDGSHAWITSGTAISELSAGTGVEYSLWISDEYWDGEWLDVPCESDDSDDNENEPSDVDEGSEYSAIRSLISSAEILFY